MTLRQLLQELSKEEILRAIRDKDPDDNLDGYHLTIEELLALPEHQNPKKLCPIVVRKEKDYFDGEEFIDVCLKNINFKEEAPYDLLPWGGKGDDKNDAPKGYFNVNYSGYSKYFGMMGLDRKDIIDVLIIDEVGLSKDKLAAEILWEITFYGFLQGDVNEFYQKIMKDMREIKDGLK